jgi:hypothetical protein
MGASQFNSPARLLDNGQIEVGGPQRLEQFQMASGIPTVEYRFLLVQGGVVVRARVRTGAPACGAENR